MGVAWLLNDFFGGTYSHLTRIGRGDMIGIMDAVTLALLGAGAILALSRRQFLPFLVLTSLVVATLTLVLSGILADRPKYDFIIPISAGVQIVIWLAILIRARRGRIAVLLMIPHCATFGAVSLFEAAMSVSGDWL